MYTHFLLIFIPEVGEGQIMYFLSTALNQQLSLMIKNCIFLVKEYQKSSNNASGLRSKKKKKI